MKKALLLLQLCMCTLLFSAPVDNGLGERVADSAWRSKGAAYKSPYTFVENLYKNEKVTIPPLPEMRDKMTRVELTDAKPGDILIFNGKGSESAGVYLGDRNFAYVVDGKAVILQLSRSSEWWIKLAAVVRHENNPKAATAGVLASAQTKTVSEPPASPVAEDKTLKKTSIAASESIPEGSAATGKISLEIPPQTSNERRIDSHEFKSRFLVGDERRDRILSTALDLIGTPYRYGGMSPRGFDCSGFVHYVYKQQGIVLPRTSKGQFYSGKSLTPASAKPGDLIFFTTRRGRPISHVAIYLGKGFFVHAPSRGKRVSISSFYSDRYWKYRYYGSCSILDSGAVAALGK